MKTEQKIIQELINNKPEGCTLKTIIKDLPQKIPKRSLRKRNKLFLRFPVAV